MSIARLYQANRKGQAGITGDYKGAQPVIRTIVRTTPPVNVDSAPCTCVDQTLTDAGPFTVTGGDDIQTDIIGLCTNDMRSQITVTTFSAVPNQLVYVDVRAVIYYGAFANSPATDATWRILINALDLDTPIVDTLPAPGDVLELEVHGTSLEGRRNGTPMFNVTDPLVTAVYSQGGFYLSSEPTGTVTVEDQEVETFC